MIVKQARKKFFELFEAISNPEIRKIKGIKIAYAIHRNKAKLQKEVDIFRELDSQLDPDFSKYREEIQAKAAELAEKDDNGNPKTEAKNGLEIYLIPEDKKDELKAFDYGLREKYKEGIARQDGKLGELEKMLAEEIELDLYSIPEAVLPEDISVEQLDALSLFIEQ